jgi:GDSL-like lipase/acylhydrolase family protein/SGNH-like hydrolase/esterase family protein
MRNTIWMERILFARRFLPGFLLLVLSRPCAADDVLDEKLAKLDPDGKTRWYDIALLNLEGRGWTKTEAFYDRLPAKAKGIVREPVWNLSRDSAGMCVRFVTDATVVQTRWTLRSETLALPHMPATGVSGLDLYVRTEKGGWRWLSVGRPTKFPVNSVDLVKDIAAGRREFLLYLPLYNGVQSVELGIPKDSTIAKAGPWGPGTRKPILFYGTSITQGGCASRPGMVHTAILGRWLNYPVINLGFSGNGKMEQEIADLLAELDPAVYLLDCLPNMTAAEVIERVEPFVRTLRKAHPKTPIVLVEDRSYTDSFLVTSKRQRNLDSRAALHSAHERLLAAGIQDLYYIPGETLLGDDGEDTVDSSHPTDLGFMRQANAFRPVIEKALRSEK